MLKTHPAVFAIADTYQIMVPVDTPSYFWIRVGGKDYFDHICGIKRSNVRVHRATVPMDELDRAGEYTVCVQEILGDRVPYFTKCGEVLEYNYSFYPVKGESFRAFILSDTHGWPTLPKKCAEGFGDFDVLFLLGDIPGDCGRENCYEILYDLASSLCGGTKPVIFSRGNHEVRGNWAELYADCIPTCNQKTYYTVRLGSLWAMVFDCGEDKPDESEECGGSVAFHDYRVEETEFLRSVIEKGEYKEEGIIHRFLISHIPFCFERGKDFNIEGDIYSLWASLAKEHIKPRVMLCGHLHRAQISEIGGQLDSLGQPCPVVVGSEMRPNFFASYGFCASSEGIDFVCYDFEGNITEEYKIEY